MRYLFHITTCLWAILGGIVACANQTGLDKPLFKQAEFFNLKWAENKFWDDGLAEVAVYNAERVIYNKKRLFEYTYITVKEDFNRQFNVKTDDYQRKDVFPVMKVNAFCRIETDNYPYHFLTSLFFKRHNSFDLHKLTSSSQEWCGNTFKSINAINGKYQFRFDSYWDNQGANEFSLDSNILFEDQLPYTLRSLKFKEGLTFSARIAEFQQTNKANKPTIYQGQFTVITANDSSQPATWKIVLALSAEKQNTYWFSTSYPHILIRQETWDGRHLILKNVKRYNYWQH